MSAVRVLFVEDSEDDAALVARHLERSGFSLQYFRVDTRESFENALNNAPWDVVISDHSMPKFSSMDALRVLKAREVDCPFIIVSGTIGEETAVEAMRAGAHDYVLKGNLARLGPALQRELDDAELRRQAREERQARQSIERQLQHAQKMEAVGRLAGGIAHDFNNLLTAILGFSGLALDRLDTKGNVRFELEQVKLAAERATRFTRQLLAFSRQQVVALRVIDPLDAIAVMAPMLRQLMGADVQLEVDGARDVGRIKIDPGQFEQLIMNLAVNARDAMPNGGTLRLIVEAEEVPPVSATRLLVQPGPYLVISAADTGLGIDEATRLRIFEPFFTTKPEGEGTGLGLSTVYGILKQNGGAIDVESEVNRGTTFRLYLPQVEAVQDTTPPLINRKRMVHEGHATVLVAEDEESVRVLIRTVLAGAGFEVLEAGSGIEAQQLIEQRVTPIDLLITDVVMPGMIGPDLARVLQTRFPDVRVLYITGYATHSAIPAGFMNDDDALMQKPFLPEQLLSRVHERLGLTT
jgi:signal transduction histidine kinase